jgi:hypothetical protein
MPMFEDIVPNKSSRFVPVAFSSDVFDVDKISYPP